MAFTQSVREDFGRMVQEATKLSGLSFSTEEEPKQKRNRNSASNQADTFSSKDNFKIYPFYMICDSIREQLKQKMEAYEGIVSPFRIFIDLSILKEERKNSIENIKAMFKIDSDGTNLEDEFEHFFSFMKDHEHSHESV